MPVTLPERVARLERAAEAADARLERELAVADSIHTGITAAITTLTAIVDRHDGRLRGVELNLARAMGAGALVAVLLSVIR